MLLLALPELLQMIFSFILALPLTWTELNFAAEAI